MSDDNTDLTEEIQENATAPRSATVSGNSASQHSLPDQIAADRYLKGQAAAKSGGSGLRFFKLIPPGATDVQPR